MRKKIKYSVSSFIIILSLMLGYVAYAEDATDKSESNVPINPISEKIGEMNKLREENKVQLENTIQGVKNEVQAKKAELEQNKNEIKNQIDNIKNEVGVNKEEAKNTIQAMIKTVQGNRDQFKIEVEAKKEEAQAKIAEMKVKFQEGLKKIKDEVKKTATENIVNTIQELNVKMTNNFSNKIDQIETVLISIESRISKAESNGLDVTAVKVEVEKSKVAIESARTAISTQAGKTYEVNITDEATLKNEMTTLRNTFSKDIKAVNALIKSAHEAVRNTATTLAQIPNIDNSVEESVTVENTTNNQ